MIHKKLSEHLKSTPEENETLPEEKLKLSPEAEARKQRILSQIRKNHRKAQKKLKEYEEDMKVINFSEDESFDRAERQWLFGNDL